MTCRFCDRENLRWHDETLTASGPVSMVTRLGYNGLANADAVIWAYCRECVAGTAYHPKYCPECGRKLRDDAGETA